MAQPLITKQFTFNGQWLPDKEPLQLDENDFAKLENFRYVDGGIEPIEGYTEINTTALDTYFKVRSGIQLRSAFTQKTYVLLEAWNVHFTLAKIVDNQTSIPDQGDFESTYPFTPTTGAPIGRFGHFPRGIGYCNELQSCIYEGLESRAGAIFAIDSISGLTPTNPIDYTEILSNSLQDADNRVASLGSTKQILIASTRRLQGFKCYISTGNSSASTMTVKEWQGTGGWSAALSVTDNTSFSSISLQRTGTVTWTETGLGQPAFFEGIHLYLYHVYVSAGDATIYQITINASFQTIKDIWDGVYREVASFQHDHGTGFEDYTLQVLESTGDLDYYVAAEIGQMATGHSIRVMFEDRLTALRIEMVPKSVNTNVAAMTIKYWSGSAYVTVGTIYDGTLDDSGGTKTLNQTGTVFWTPPVHTSEHPKSEFGVTGYSYEITVSATLSGSAQTDVLIDLVYGIPAQKIVRGHKFPSRFQGHTMLCGAVIDMEPNRVDYSVPNAPDVYNGEQSSDYGKSLYFGGSEKLTAAGSLYNRFGSRIFETWVATKESETYLLDGSGPDDFRIYQISINYGCPAPETFVVAEVGYQVAQEAIRNIAIWLSYRGPVIFDGAVIIPLRGIDLYFDTRKDSCINFDCIENSRAWFDSYWMEYNLLIPSGPAQVTTNVWLVYDLRRQRWYRKKVADTAEYPQHGIIVKDEHGVVYQYVFTDDGIMHRGEYGSTWNGENIKHLVRSADMLPSGSIFDETTLETLKIVHQLPDFGNTTDYITLKIAHILNGGRDKKYLPDFTVQYTDYLTQIELVNEDEDQLINEDDDRLIADYLGETRYAIYTKGLDRQGLSHQFEFSRDSDAYSYFGNFSKRLIGYGFTARRSRQDI